MRYVSACFLKSQLSVECPSLPVKRSDMPAPTDDGQVSEVASLSKELSEDVQRNRSKSPHGSARDSKRDKKWR